MRFEFEISGQKWFIETKSAFDLSIAVNCATGSGAKAWYVAPPQKSTVHLGDWIGSVAQGGSVNFNNLSLNPHAHGTHTESLGHISPNEDSVEGLFDEFFFECLVVSLTADDQGRISRQILQQGIESSGYDFWPSGPRALVVRTLPNSPEKRTLNYDNQGWPYLSENAAQFLSELGVEHLLIDTPSVDPEQDQGALLAHHAFWQWPDNPRHKASITELIFVPDTIKDGPYLLELQTAAIVNDATLSRPLLYELAAV